MSSVHACHHCGLLQTLPVNTLSETRRLHCQRCGSLLIKETTDSLQITLALTLTALLLLVITLIYPFMELHVEGKSQEATLLTGIEYFYHNEMVLLAGIVALTCVVFPLLLLSSLTYILIPMNMGRVALGTDIVLRVFKWVVPWSMMEVFLLGILISAVKLGKLATMESGLGLWAFITLIITSTIIFACLNLGDIWRKVPLRRPVLDPRHTRYHAVCSVCHLTLGWPTKLPVNKSLSCPRCQAKVNYRKPKSIQRATALVIAAGVLYIPANLLPITQTSFLGTEQSDTIMSGVLYFMSSGSWHIALVIFVASVFIPLVKLFILAFLIIATKGNVRLSPKKCTTLYHLTEIVGRWSMVDVFVVTVLVAMVQLKPFAMIKPGVGVVYFAVVVVLTMLAAESFDPRLLWKLSDQPNPHSRDSQ